MDMDHHQRELFRLRHWWSMHSFLCDTRMSCHGDHFGVQLILLDCTICRDGFADCYMLYKTALPSFRTSERQTCESHPSSIFRTCAYPVRHSPVRELIWIRAPNMFLLAKLYLSQSFVSCMLTPTRALSLVSGNRQTPLTQFLFNNLPSAYRLLLVYRCHSPSMYLDIWQLRG